jgi:ribose transport system ATP-binding protein
VVATSAPKPLLEMRDISKAFPGVQALDHVSLTIRPGEVVGLVGENGAGKSTLMKILCGAYSTDTGEILVGGTPNTPQNPRHAQDLGIAIIYQEFNLTPNQTVATNLFLAREPGRAGLLGTLQIVDRATMRREALRLLDRVGASIDPDTVVQRLSVAQRQMVEIAKALAVDASVIIMDEPTSALGEDEVAKLFEIIHTLRDQGLGIVFITHRLDEIFSVADRVVVLRDGQLVGEMPIAEATHDKIISLMVGRSIDQFFHRTVSAPDGDKPVVLEVRHLSSKNRLHDISFSLHSGEVLGVAGLVGSGRTDMARAIFGADPKDSGEVLIQGQPVPIDMPLEAVKAGLALVPENRQTEGLILMHSVEQNVALPNLDALSRGEFVRRGYLREIVNRFVDRLHIRTPSLAQKVMFLSGGNQQKTALAKWLASGPKVLILDEPTRGIDVGAKAEVYTIIDQLAQSGIGIIMISSEMPEILQMSDRILVMHEGRVAAILGRAEANQEVIMAYASGMEAEASVVAS